MTEVPSVDVLIAQQRAKKKALKRIKARARLHRRANRNDSRFTPGNVNKCLRERRCECTASAGRTSEFNIKWRDAMIL